MRVGVLTTSYPREADDPAGAFVAGFTRWLSARAEVEVLCADAARPLFYRGGAPQALRRGRWGEALSFSGRLLATAAARARGWDALVSHWLVPSGAVGRLVAGRRPHLAIAHGSDVRLLLKLPGGRALVRHIAAVADLVYVASHLQIEGAPGRVVPMGVEVAAWRGGEREATRLAYGAGDFVALFMGRLIAQKGVDRAIDALPDGFELWVAGEGPERTKLEARARGKAVRFLGEERGVAKRNLLAAADALLVPSLEDGAPTVILEALAAGLPIVASPVGGIPALVGDAGLFGLGELSRLRDDRSLRARLAGNARAQAGAHDWSVVGPQLAASLGLSDGSDDHGRLPNEAMDVTRL